MENKICLVTGASQGLGYSLSLRLAQKHATVIMVDTNIERLQKSRLQIIELTQNPNIDFLHYRQGHPEDIKSLTDHVLHRYSHLDLLANLTEYRFWKKTGHKSKIGSDRNLNENVLIPFLLTHFLLPRLIASGNSQILNLVRITSQHRKVKYPDLLIKKRFPLHRCFSQINLVRMMWSKALQDQLSHTNVKVQALDPGLTRSTVKWTPFHPLQILKSASGLILGRSCKEVSSKVLENLEYSNIRNRDTLFWYLNHKRLIQVHDTLNPAAFKNVYRICEKLTGVWVPRTSLQG